MSSAEFQNYSKRVTALKAEPSNEQKLDLYALFKIAEKKEPEKKGMFDMQFSYKKKRYDEKKAEGITPAQAEKDYVTLVKKLEKEIGIDESKLKNLNLPPVKSASKPPTKEPAKAATKEPAKAPAKLSAKEPAKAPAKPPAKAPAKAPGKLPAKEPTKAPAKLPAKAPTEQPAKLPAKKPAKLPAKPTE